MVTTPKTDCTAEVAPVLSKHDAIMLHCVSLFDNDDFEEVLYSILAHFKHDEAGLDTLAKIVDDYTYENYPEYIATVFES
jgi:hypothetical protein